MKSFAKIVKAPSYIFDRVLYIPLSITCTNILVITKNINSFTEKNFILLGCTLVQKKMNCIRLITIINMKGLLSIRLEEFPCNNVNGTLTQEREKFPQRAQFFSKGLVVTNT